jgi:glycosyltransferase involved in cell wall biosynthesis
MLFFMSIAVIIPSYNRASKLQSAVDSVLAQELQAAEIIIVDDGSTDTTAAMIRTRYAGKVHYCYQPNRGVSAARNHGIRVASAPWLAFLDSDDTWLEEKLREQWSLVCTEARCRVVHSNEIWVRNGQRVNPKARHRKIGGQIYQHCLPLCPISPSAVMVHRDVFTEVGVFDETLPACEDYDMWLRITAHYPVHYVDRPLVVKHGGHRDQLSRRYWGMDRFRIRALVKILDTGSLTPANDAATREMLKKKIEVYLEGATKRSKTDEVKHYSSLKRDYCRVGAQA